MIDFEIPQGLAELRGEIRAFVAEQIVPFERDPRLTRHGPGKRLQSWEANPYWVRVTRHVRGGPVPHYLTLSGGPREVEIGAFLTPEERLQLEGELRAHLRACAEVPGPTDANGA